ncbi:hypothetical protein [Moorena sp. SIO3H5]|nr:hypothetical protein [Moorena sp. SIO3H5]NEO71925.1 hypothetical protein [Moorena sp. SIO3H5]
MATLREQHSAKGLWPRYANSIQLKAFGHATRTADVSQAGSLFHKADR